MRPGRRRLHARVYPWAIWPEAPTPPWRSGRARRRAPRVGHANRREHGRRLVELGRRPDRWRASSVTIPEQRSRDTARSVAATDSSRSASFRRTRSGSRCATALELDDLRGPQPPRPERPGGDELFASCSTTAWPQGATSSVAEVRRCRCTGRSGTAAPETQRARMRFATSVRSYDEIERCGFSIRFSSHPVIPLARRNVSSRLSARNVPRPSGRPRFELALLGASARTLRSTTCRPARATATGSMSAPSAAPCPRPSSPDRWPLRP